MTPSITIAFLTGQSDPKNNALSPAQADFLAQFDGAARELVDVNFPYTSPAPYSHRRTPLLKASWSNFRHYFGSRNAGFSTKHRDALAAMIERRERMVFLAGSCGLELFNNLRLPKELEERCLLICYGPVARRQPEHATIFTAQGRGDWISRVLFRHDVSVRLDCGHMDYLENPDFARFCQKQIKELETTTRDQEARR